MHAGGGLPSRAATSSCRAADSAASRGMSGSRQIPFDPEADIPALRGRESFAGTEVLPEAEESDLETASDYRAAVRALEVAERALEHFRAAEAAFLAHMLPAATSAAIAEVHSASAQEITALEAEIEAKERSLALARGALAEARRAAAEADLQAGFLARPAAAIRDRLERAEEIRAEAAEASEAGHYALAYWLVMPGGQLDRAIRAEPAIVPADQLAAARAAAAARRTDTRERVAEITAQVAALHASLEEDRARLATWKSRSDASILDELSRLDSATDMAS